MTEQTWLPEPSEASKPFFDGCSEGVLRIQKCQNCGTWAYPITTACSNCGSYDIGWDDASGDATLYAHGLLQRVYHPRHDGNLPVIIAQIDLVEGLRIFSNVVNVDPQELKAGDALKVTFETFPDGGTIPVFEPA